MTAYKKKLKDGAPVPVAPPAFAKKESEEEYEEEDE